MDFRHEWKHEISCADLFALRPRLTAVMQPDAHAVHGRYEIRSMYFDNLQDKALREKIDWTVAADTKKTLLQELYLKQKIQGLRPKTIVDYTREPFVYAAGNVRVTLDYHIRTGMRCTDFLNPQCVMVPAGDAPIILEVKWETFLPAVIRDIVQIPGTHTSAFSKYAACRIYG